MYKDIAFKFIDNWYKSGAKYDILLKISFIKPKATQMRGIWGISINARMQYNVDVMSLNVFFSFSFFFFFFFANCYFIYTFYQYTDV